MHKLEELKEMLMDELNKVTKKGELSAGSLDIVDKLTHSIKSICTIMAMDEYDDEYSEARGGSSYARGRGSNARRDSMGRYASRGSYEGGSSYARGGRGGRSNRGYSRDEAKEELVEQLRDIEMMAEDEETKKMVKRWIKQAMED